MANVEIHPDALREYQRALAWYQDRNLVVSRRFVAEVDRVLSIIAANPDRYGWYDTEFREAGLKRFPFSIIYHVDAEGTVLVVAIAHASRQPGYWQNRVRTPE